jgi:2'-hydroxyisoflavone reductase
VGPHDPTGRFTYWVRRIAASGEVLVPTPAAGPVQIIDARDLADWTVRMVAEGKPGVFNATGPAHSLTMGALVEAGARATSSTARFTWVDPDFLLERGVEPWSELPLWLPGEQGLMQANVAAATGAGLRFRPLEDTVRDTWDWVRALPEPPGDAGMAPEREATLLAEWRMAS